LIDSVVLPNVILGSKPKSGSDTDVKGSSSVGQLRKLPSAAGSSLKREAASVPSGIGLVIKKPRIASQTFTPLGRAVEADRRASPTTQVYLYEEIAAEGMTFHCVLTSVSLALDWSDWTVIVRCATTFHFCLAGLIFPCY